MRETDHSAEAMAAGEAWTPAPYPKRCAVCGGTGRIYVKVNGIDGVRNCACRQQRIEVQKGQETEAMIARYAQLKRSPLKRRRRKPKPGDDPEYLTFLHEQPCAIEAPLNLHVGPIEAAHVGLRGLSQKCPDREAIPLCRWHHREGPLSHHVLGKRFWGRHGLDKTKLIGEYNRRFEEQQ